MTSNRLRRRASSTCSTSPARSARDHAFRHRHTLRDRCRRGEQAPASRTCCGVLRADRDLHRRPRTAPRGPGLRHAEEGSRRRCWTPSRPSGSAPRSSWPTRSGSTGCWRAAPTAPVPSPAAPWSCARPGGVLRPCLTRGSARIGVAIPIPEPSAPACSALASPSATPWRGPFRRTSRSCRPCRCPGRPWRGSAACARSPRRAAVPDPAPRDGHLRPGLAGGVRLVAVGISDCENFERRVRHRPLDRTLIFPYHPP